MSIDWNFVVPKSKPLPKAKQDNPLATPSITMIIGGTGSGKSVCMSNILMALQDIHEFDSGLFVTSNGRDPILDTIEMPITQKPSDLEDYISKVRNSKEGTNHILVLDDCQGSKDFNIMTNRSTFVSFVLSHRHFGENKKKAGLNGTWLIITAQTLKNSFSTQVRNQVKNWILYYPRTPTELRNYDELAQDPAMMRRAMAIVKSEGRHAFLFLNKHDPERDRYYLGFNDEMRDLN